MKVQVYLAVLASVICAAMAMKCKSCMQFVVQSDDKNVQQAMGMLDAMSDQNCKDNAGAVKDMDCPAAGSGVKAVCANTAISTAMEIPDSDIQINMEMYMRMCHAVPASQELGCEDLDDYQDEIKQSMGPNANMFGRMDGQMCFCEGDRCNSNGITASGKPSGDKGSKGDGKGGAAGLVVLFSSFLSLLLHLV